MPNQTDLIIRSFRKFINSKGNKKENNGYTTSWEEVPLHAKAYIKNEIRKAKIISAEYIVNSSAFVSYVALISLIFLLILIFVSITFALLLYKSTGSVVIGFGLISIFYILVFLVLFIFRKRLIIKPIRNFLSREISETLELNKEEEELPQTDEDNRL